MARRYYVTAVEGPRVFRLAGPYATKAAAESKVGAAREIACDFARNSQAGRAAFMAYGVSRITSEGKAPPASLGVL